MKNEYTYQDLIEFEMAKELTKYNIRPGQQRVPESSQMRKALEVMEKYEISAPMRRAKAVLEIYEKAAKFNSILHDNNNLQLDIAKISKNYMELVADHARLLITVNAQKFSIWTRIKNALFKTTRS